MTGDHPQLHWIFVHQPTVYQPQAKPFLPVGEPLEGTVEVGFLTVESPKQSVLRDKVDFPSAVCVGSISPGGPCSSKTWWQQFLVELQTCFPGDEYVFLFDVSSLTWDPSDAPLPRQSDHRSWMFQQGSTKTMRNQTLDPGTEVQSAGHSLTSGDLRGIVPLPNWNSPGIWKISSLPLVSTSVRRRAVSGDRKFRPPCLPPVATTPISLATSRAVPSATKLAMGRLRLCGLL